jgi:hypothetical protein
MTFLKLVKLMFIAIVSFIILFTMYFYSYNEWLSQEAQDKKIYVLYQQLVNSTGQSQEGVPLVIVEKDIDNAYNDGTEVVIYRGLINHTRNWDELALVLAHEVAHGMLWHLKMPFNTLTAGQVSVLEANADKMGALYVLKIGYNVCRGREIFRHWKEEQGNQLNENHPDFSYRYDELNINCGD